MCLALSKKCDYRPDIWDPEADPVPFGENWGRGLEYFVISLGVLDSEGFVGSY